MKQTNLPTEAKKKNLKKIDAEPKPTLYKEAPAPGDFKQKNITIGNPGFDGFRSKQICLLNQRRKTVKTVLQSRSQNIFYTAPAPGDFKLEYFCILATLGWINLMANTSNYIAWEEKP